jgi:hypothetical protein
LYLVGKVADVNGSVGVYMEDIMGGAEAVEASLSLAATSLLSRLLFLPALITSIAKC